MNKLRACLLLLLVAHATWALAEPKLDPGIAQAVSATQAAVGDHRLILLGEKHGTREIPLYVAALVEALSADGRVVLGLELPRSEQAAWDEFLQSDGAEQAQNALRSRPLWAHSDDQHDGRRNQEVIEMLERLRQLRARGRDIGVLPFDRAVGAAPSDHHERDREMAAYLREHYLAEASARVIALAGNVHAMRQKPEYAPPEMQRPMGNYLLDLNPFSINITANSGEFWACNPKCAPRAELPANAPSRAVDDVSYQFEVVLPRFSVARFQPDAR